MSGVSIIIPAYNEADRIAETVKAAKLLGDEVLVVDDGSQDDTAAVAESAGADRVIKAERNGGKGAAMNIGCAAAKCDILLLLDADLGETAREAGALLPPIVNGETDMTIAAFPKAAGKAGFGAVVKLSRWGIKQCTGQIMECPLSGQRAMKKEVFEAIGGFGSGFGVETGLTIDVIRKGFRVQEIPVNLNHRATGRDLAGFLHRGKQLWDVARILARKRVGR